MGILQRPNALPFGIDPRNLIALTYQNKSMIGLQQSMGSLKKKFLREKSNNTTFLDANLLHDFVSGKSVTAVLHFVNTTPTAWYLKRQATVETVPYDSEFVAAKTATEHIRDLRNTLRYLGVPIMTKAYMFSENKSVMLFNSFLMASLHTFRIFSSSRFQRFIEYF